MGTDVEVLAVGADAAAMAELGELAADRARGARSPVVALPADQRAVPGQRRRRRAGRGVGRHLRADRPRRRRVARHRQVATTRRCSPRSKPRATTATSTPCARDGATPVTEPAPAGPGLRRAWSSTGLVSRGAAAVRRRARPRRHRQGLRGRRRRRPSCSAPGTRCARRARQPGRRPARPRGRAAPHGWVVGRRRSARHRTHRAARASARARSPRARGCGGRGSRGDVALHHLIDPRTGAPARVGAGVGHGRGRRGVAGRGAGQGGVRRRARRGRAPRRPTPVPPGCSSPTTARSSSWPASPPSVRD